MGARSNMTEIEDFSEVVATARNNVVNGVLEEPMVPGFYDLFYKNPRFKLKRYVLLCGGRGSGKSHGLCQYLCYLMVTQTNMKFVISRKTNPSLTRTVYKGSPSIIETLRRWGIQFKHRRADQEIEVNGNTVYFLSMDDPTKIKSMNVNYVWMEEANEFTWKDFIEFDAIARADNPYGTNQVFMSFNPTKYYHWTVQVFYLTPIPVYKDKSIYTVSTPFTNPYLPLESKEMYLRAGDNDPALFKTNVLGEPSTPAGLVYTHFKTMPEELWPEAVWHIQPIYGVDFGFVHPMVIVEGRRYEDTWYIREMFYKDRQTVQDMVNHMQSRNLSWKETFKPIPELYPDDYEDQLDLWERGTFVPNLDDYEAYGCERRSDLIPWYFDTSSRYWCDHQPDQYSTLMRGGFDGVYHARDKNVRAGIMTVKANKIIISASSTNMLEEARSYQWMELKANELVPKDEPIKEKDDAMDALRYLIHSSSMRNKSGKYVGNTTALKENATVGKTDKDILVQADQPSEPAPKRKRYVYVPPKSGGNTKI